MLQRAASSAYSWWWASQIRTKQSKWLDSNLQEMEEKVKNMIKLIDADGDSFARKAEMYFKRRPELIDIVEDSFRSYKALADRYDRISGELHKANHTIATAFPDQVQFVLDDEDDDGFQKPIPAIDVSQFRKQTAAPQIGTKGKTKEEGFTLRKTHQKKINSPLSKEKAQKELDKLQKEILVLQTEKEFVKSSYESGLAKYWDLEKQITEIQEDVCNLQDEFGASAEIEDDEARALMSATALKSCENTLVSLSEQQKTANEEARIESQRIKETKEKLMALRTEYGQAPANFDVSIQNSGPDSISTEENDFGIQEERLELESVCQKVREHFQMSSETSMVELAEKIDELVEKVIDLELTVASQTAQIRRMRSEMDELQKHLSGLEEDKATLIGDSKALAQRLKQAEKELKRIQHLERCVQVDKSNLQSSLKEACHSFNDISEELQSPKDQEQFAETLVVETKNVDVQIHKATGKVDKVDPQDQLQDKSKDLQKDQQLDVGVSAADSSFTGDDIRKNSQLQEQLKELVDSPDMRNLLLSGLEGKEKILFSEYTSLLRNFNDTKTRLSELEIKNLAQEKLEIKNQEDLSETMEQVKELKMAIAKKDEEIQNLRQILSSLQTNSNLKAAKSFVKSEEPNDDSASKPNAPAKTTETEIPPDFKLPQANEPEISSAVEDKFRADIDTLLEENLDFWLRFSTSYHQIQRFQTAFKGLKLEIEELNKIKSQEASSSDPTDSKEVLKNESAPIEKKLRELNTEVQVWLENNAMLNGELQCRLSSLCTMQEEISRVSRASDSETTDLSPYQSAKLQGEVRNMRLENDKVAKELQTGMDYARGLQVEIAKTLSQIRQCLQLTTSKGQNHHRNQVRHVSPKRKVPLRTFLFSSKQKKQNFSWMLPGAPHGRPRAHNR